MFGNDWDIILQDEFDKPYYLGLRSYLQSEYAEQTVYPNMSDIFNAFKFTAYQNVKVVILGQDPYHNEGQAHGLAFSVKRGVDVPPSLKNIYKEMSTDIDFIVPKHGNLENWAKNGVFLLNATLTVRAGQAASHKGKGWENFTDNVISKLSDRAEPMVFLLWGANARAKASLIDSNRHLVLQAVHPSPLSAYNGFFGCRHFSLANEFLAKHNKKVNWEL